jgi:hypothetical protein
MGLSQAGGRAGRQGVGGYVGPEGGKTDDDGGDDSDDIHNSLNQSQSTNLCRRSARGVMLLSGKITCVISLFLFGEREALGTCIVISDVSIVSIDD